MKWLNGSAVNRAPCRVRARVSSGNRAGIRVRPPRGSRSHVRHRGRVLVQIDGARRAKSYNFYKKVTGTDAEPVKLLNTQRTQQIFENLPADSTVEITVTGVNNVGEGPASEP